MDTILLSPNCQKRGGPLWIILSIIKHYHKNVVFQDYEPSTRQNGVFLGYNKMPRIVMQNDDARKVLFVGGGRRIHNGIPRPIPHQKIHKIVCNSEFYSRIIKSIYPEIELSVIHVLGGAPADTFLSVPNEHRKELDISKDTINFIANAKWSKRKFKRLKQIKLFFTEYIRKKYPNSMLHVIGYGCSQKDGKNHIIYYRRDFHSSLVSDVYKLSHIQLMFSPFDTGPMTLTESMHYKVPFICSNNCCGSELIDLVTGKCGEVVHTDPSITSAEHCIQYKPFSRIRFYGKPLPYDLLMESVNSILHNYNQYTSWLWTDTFNYQAQSQKWMNTLFG